MALAVLLALLSLCAQGLVAADCALNAVFYDGGGSAFRVVQSGLSVTVTSLGSRKWDAKGTLDPSPMWCPYDGSATIQTPCHALHLASEQAPHKADVVVSGECDLLLAWSTNEVPWVVPDPTLLDIHVVSMTHLDVGFTDTARNVCDLYLDKFFPLAFQTSAKLAARGGPEQFIWTEFPWLIVEYLEGYAGCAHRLRSQEEIDAMTSAIRAGWIQWHGNALNNFIELQDAGLFNFSLSLRGWLNKRFNTTHGRLVGKHSDVPGLSRSAIPILAANGIRAYHIGFNGACKLPDVLPPVFVWRHPETQTELLTFVENNYGRSVRVPRSPSALFFHYKVDNSGPPTPDEVIAFWALLKRRFPRATIRASSLDAYAETILNNATVYSSLPVVTDEIGDSWLYGSPADPIKLASLREARRFLDSNVQQGKISTDCEYYTAFMHRLLKGPGEHNWGLSIGNYLPGLRSTSGNWSNSLFHAVKGREDYQVLEAEWAEQRGFCHPLPTWSPEQRRLQCSASDVAAWDTFIGELETRLDCIRRGVPFPDEPVLDDSTVMQDLPPGEVVVCDRFHVSIDGTSGAINYLYDSLTNVTWAQDATTPLARLSYRTYTLADFDRFNSQYNPNCGPPCGDFSKQGMQAANPESREWLPRVRSVRSASHARFRNRPADASPCQFSVSLQFDDMTVSDYGAAQEYSLHYTVPGTSGAAVDISLTWRNKTATRLAEALFLSFTPLLPASNNSVWGFDVLGRPIDPLHVVANGTRHLHAVWDGVGVNTGPHSLYVKTRDVPLVAPGDNNHLLWFDGDALPNMRGGVHFNVHNNLWGTAFPQWYSDDGRAVFQIILN